MEQHRKGRGGLEEFIAATVFWTLLLFLLTGLVIIGGGAIRDLGG